MCTQLALSNGTDLAHRVHTHLLIDDAHSALVEARRGIADYPDSKPLRLALIKALCASGLEIEALEQWKELEGLDADLLTDRVALEVLAWGVLNKGVQSSQLSIKANALIGAAMTRDAKAVPLILDALRGSNSMLRSLAIGLASAYGDFPLQDEIARLLKVERVWFVKVELIRAVGALKMAEAKDLLIDIISDPRTMAEEKVAAILSLTSLYETVSHVELSSLLKSNRAGLRQLACQIITHFDLCDKADLIVPLLSDTHAEVRKSALTTLALLGVDQIEGKPVLAHPKVGQLLKDPLADVAITASWLALIRGDKRGEKALRYWVIKGESRLSRLAAGALAVSGRWGVPLSQKLLRKTKDPYVQIMLAIGLIGQRESVEMCCQILSNHLLMSEKWMWDTTCHPLFRFVSPSRVPLHPQIPNYPEVINQVTRLQILQILCILKYEGAHDAVKAFLSAHTWRVVGEAASTLIQEGDDEALDIVRGLLDDPDEKIRFQAAMVLAQLGNDKKAVDVLKEAYPRVDREIKIQILEAIAKVADPDAVTFLLKRLHEPFQVLRVVAATALIRCLYH